MPAPDRPAAGAALMVAGMLVFPVGDAVAKHLSADHGTFFLSWARLAFGAAVVLPLAVISRRPLPPVDARLIVEQTVRTAFAVLAILLFIAALGRIPLADVVGAYLTAPLFAALFAVLLLGERIAERVLLLALVGFAGALLIVRPGASMDIGSLYALGAGASFGGFLVAGRWATRDVPPLPAVAFQTTLGALILAPFAVPALGGVGAEVLPWLLAMGLCSAGANMLVIAALRLAPAGFLAPLVYVEILGATALGWLAFGDVPAPLTWIGIALVTLSGLGVARMRAA